jgi:hypothetical protein
MSRVRRLQQRPCQLAARHFHGLVFHNIDEIAIQSVRRKCQNFQAQDLREEAKASCIRIAVACPNALALTP